MHGTYQLCGPELAIAGISETGDNECAFIQVVIDCGKVYRNLRVVRLHVGYTFWSPEKTNELDPLYPPTFEDAHSGARRSPGREHGVQDQTHGDRGLYRQLVVVLDRPEALL